MERLTNEQAKQEAIKKAWGEYYDKVKKDLDQNGFAKRYNHQESWQDISNDYGIDFNFIINCYFNDYGFCPQKLDTNNGWTRIEPDGSNLPDKNGNTQSYKIGKLEDGKFDIFSYEVQTNWLSLHYKSKNVTHYKPIEKELLPIY